MSIQQYIDDMYALIKGSEPVTLSNERYLAYKNGLTEYVFSHHLDEEPEWNTIKRNLVWRSGQYMVRNGANQILVALERLKQVELKREHLKTLDAWSYLHPTIAEAAKDKFSHGDYEGAVQDALLEINGRLKGIYKTRRGEERDGTDLMRQVFSPDSPILVIGDLATKTGRDMQEGYMHLFEGAMMGIRNPSAHQKVPTTSNDAMRKLMLASLLMPKVDEATLP